MLPEWWLSNSGQVAQREPEYSYKKKLVDPNDEEALKRIAEDVIVCKG